ncbi:putative amino acid permease [Aspergillus saccharolyticus JOP 1030-1]|uniref:Putative amino acid permease n=1 Tax=Aspergillus saccharolyticus JOP 1030-1 TaxID=1450539 RepID=A0A318ZPD6_9EURO|nr:putative amino acid permease [Aspergillus saccharolyticus JOP 1030-1]PYH48857.1 putative amino acid permease [Aspergillus saccharolyticus JOP 1030-1]
MICAGRALSQAGPASILISYTCVGIIVYLVLCALGEVASWSPEPSMAENASRFCDPALGFTLGWIYWLKFMLVIPNQCAAGELLIAYWQGNDEKGYSILWITLFLAMIIVANLKCTQYFDKYEIFISVVKIIVMLGLLCLCIVLALGGGPKHDKKGFRYWSYPGAFAQHSGKEAAGILRAVFRTVPSATLAYLGSELMGITILRTHNPREAAGQAIESNCYRILAVNIVNVALLGLLVPSDAHALALGQTPDKPRPASAFVTIAQYTGWSQLPHILNAFLLVCVISAASQALYLATRTLYELAIDQHAPSFLDRTNNRGIPIYALGVCAVIGCTAYLNAFSRSQKLFKNHVNLVSMFSILTWASMLVVHISFVRVRKVQRIADGDLVFKAPFGVFGSWVALLACIFFSIIRVFDLTNSDAEPRRFDYLAFMTSYAGIPLYAILAVGYKLVTRSHTVSPDSVEMKSIKAGQDTVGAGRPPAAWGQPLQVRSETARMR